VKGRLGCFIRQQGFLGSPLESLICFRLEDDRPSNWPQGRESVRVYL